MDKTYFVMLHNQKGTRLVPLLESDGELAMFDTPAAARDAGERNPVGEAFGYLVFDADFPA